METLSSRITLGFLAFLLAFGLPLTGIAKGRYVSDTEIFHPEYPVQQGEKGGMPARFLLDNEGLFVTDFNRDFRPDLMLTGGTVPYLYRNDGGIFKRVEFPEIKSKISFALRVDYNSDGWWDFVLIPREGRIKLFKNDRGTFVLDRSLKQPELKEGIGATAGDFNKDGCPDLFVIQYNNTSEEVFRQKQKMRLGLSYEDIESDNGRRNYLLKGDCSRFQTVSDSVFERTHWSLATSFFDANNDGKLDIHVANDFFRDSLYINQGEGEFSHRYLGEATDRNGMSSEILDANNDTYRDIFVSNIRLSRKNTIWESNRFMSSYTVNPKGHNLLLNQSGKRYVDRAKQFGVNKGGWGWAVTTLDLDNDFDKELIQAKQNFLVPATALNLFRLDDYDVAYFVGKYQGNRPIVEQGTISSDLLEAFREWVGYLGVWDRTDRQFDRKPNLEQKFGRFNARGIAALDVDFDGNMEIALSQYGGHHVVLEEHQHRSNNFIKFHVKPLSSSGTLVIVDDGTKRVIPINSRTDFQSQESPYYHIGTVDRKVIDQITMRWNSGHVQTIKQVSSNQLIIFDYRETTKKVQLDE